MSATTNLTNLPLSQKVLEQLAISDAAITKSAAFEAQVEQQRAAVLAKIPEVCDTMIKFARIRPDQRDDLVRTLQDPVGALDMLIKVAGHRNPDEMAKLGQPTDANGHLKAASAKQEGGMEQFVTGARRVGLSPADRKLYTGFGLTPPG